LPVALTKEELIKRAATWGASRGVEFRESLLDEWIDKGLVAEGDRLDNVGKRPIFRYGFRHYRRVLQVLWLYSRGIKNADQILIMLFLSGRGVKPFEVREPLLREFGKSKARLNAFLRSWRFDQTGAVPPKHMQSLIKSLGRPDERFVASGMVLDPDRILAAVRAARSPDPSSSARATKNPRSEDWLLQLIKFAFGGVLFGGRDSKNEIEKLIAQASDEELGRSRAIVLSFREFFGVMAQLNRSPGKAGFDAILASFFQPNFVPSHLAMALKMMRDFSSKTPIGAKTAK